MQADQAAAEERKGIQTPLPSGGAGGGFLPPIIVGIANNESREHEEEVYCQIAVWGRRPVEALENMIQDNQQCCYATQSVEDSVVRLGVSKNNTCRRGSSHSVRVV